MATSKHPRDQVSAIFWHYDFSERLLLGVAAVGMGASIAGAAQRWLALWGVAFVLLATGCVVGRKNVEDYRRGEQSYWIPALGSQLIVVLVSWFLINHWEG